MLTIITLTMPCGARQNYYEAIALSQLYPAYFLGCKTRYIRRIVERRRIDPENYTYGKKVGDDWLPSSADYCRAKLLLKIDWAQKTIIDPKPGVSVDFSRDIDLPEEKYPECPPTIELEESDMFRDNDGNLFKVKMVGERAEEKCFFLVKDVAAAFEMPSLDRVVLNKSGAYIRGKDYICFSNHQVAIDELAASSRELYLTFDGLLHVLYASKAGCAEKFRKWARSVLFRATFGSEEEKQELSAEILNLPSKNLKALLSKSASDLPVVYLYKLENRKGLCRGAPQLFYKYGCTTNFKRRAAELDRKFKSANLEGELELYAYIDPMYVHEAETAIKTALEAAGAQVKIEGLSDAEYVSFDPSKAKFIREQFRMVAAAYAGRAADTQAKIKELEHKIEVKELQHQAELMKEKYERRLAEERVAAQQQYIDLLKTNHNRS